MQIGPLPPSLSLRDFLTVGEAAERLGVSRGTLRHWDRLGKLVAVRHPVNGYRLYRRSELDALLEPLSGGPGSLGKKGSA